jgi:hypothetical protein
MYNYRNLLGYKDAKPPEQTYFDHCRPRIDPVVCVNVLSAFHKHGRYGILPLTLSWVRDVLLHRAYLKGTRYYNSPEAFLFFLWRLCIISNDESIKALKPLLKARVKERIGANADALALAMRLLTSISVGITDVGIDYEALVTAQCDDGGWPAGCLYRFGSSGLSVGNRGFVTALALNAIRAYSVAKTKNKKHHFLYMSKVCRYINERVQNHYRWQTLVQNRERIHYCSTN